MFAVLTDPLLDRRIAASARGDEDAAQAARLEILEKLTRQPSLAEQKIGYLVKMGKWAAQHEFERRATYDRYVAPDHAGATGESPADYDFDYLPSAAETPEALAEKHEEIEALTRRLAKLPAGSRTVATLLAQGLTTVEIAAELHLSIGAVCQTVRRLRTQFTAH